MASPNKRKKTCDKRHETNTTFDFRFSTFEGQKENSVVQRSRSSIVCSLAKPPNFRLTTFAFRPTKSSTVVRSLLLKKWDKTGQNETKQDKTRQTVKVSPAVVVILQCQSKWLIKQKNQIACTDSTLYIKNILL